MPFNKSISGYTNEDEFVNALNNKMYCKLNPIFQDMLSYLYKDICDYDIIKCRLNINKQKADIFITVNNIEKGISIKKGIKNSVHVEHISTFLEFLKDNNVDDNIIKDVLLYHYGDGTLDGTGKIRISSLEYKKKFQDRLDNINLCFNGENLIKKAIDRFVLIGNNSNIPIDMLIYGVVDDFVWITKEEIINIILERKNISKQGLAFGDLFYQPMNRCLNYNQKYEKERHFIQIKWYHLSDDIIDTMRRRKKI